MDLLSFSNVEEIIFSRVANGIYSVKIKSDIKMDDRELRDTLFEAHLCKIDSGFMMNLGKEYVNVETPQGPIIESESLSIPLNIQLLLDGKLNEWFNVKNCK